MFSAPTVRVVGGLATNCRRQATQSAAGFLWITRHNRRRLSGRPSSVCTVAENPFLGMQAIRDGLITDHRLRTRYRAVYRNVYLANDVPLTADLRARAAWLWAGGDATLVGISAAAVLGTRWLDDDAPAELVRRDRHAPKGIAIRSWRIADDEMWLVDGMRVTSPARTAFDLGRLRQPREAVPILDALLRATATKSVDVLPIADSRPGSRGVRRLRSVLDFVDGGAESPQESRVRMLLQSAGLPKPETQIEFFDQYGYVRIRVDMGWREWKVAVEYDGVQHWSDRRQRSWDIDRIAILESMGWVVVRVSSEMLSRPHVIVSRVRQKLRAAGCPI